MGGAWDFQQDIKARRPHPKIGKIEIYSSQKTERIAYEDQCRMSYRLVEGRVRRKSQCHSLF